MSDDVKWRSPSMEGKWKDGRGLIHLRSIQYYGKRWIDLRIMNMENTPNNFTRHGIRINVEQVKELVPILRDLIEDIENKEEEDERKQNQSSERDTR